LAVEVQLAEKETLLEIAEKEQILLEPMRNWAVLEKYVLGA